MKKQSLLKDEPLADLGFLDKKDEELKSGNPDTDPVFK